MLIHPENSLLRGSPLKEKKIEWQSKKKRETPHMSNSSKVTFGGVLFPAQQISENKQNREAGKKERGARECQTCCVDVIRRL
jgi:hypothetical protein